MGLQYRTKQSLPKREKGEASVGGHRSCNLVVMDAAILSRTGSLCSESLMLSSRVGLLPLPLQDAAQRMLATGECTPEDLCFSLQVGE